MTRLRLTQRCRRHAVALLAAATLLLGLSPANAQQVFKTPEEAATALAAAVKIRHAERYPQGARPGWRGDRVLGDEVADREARQRFVGAYDTKHNVTVEGEKAVLVVGADDFPLPIPLVTVRRRTGSSIRPLAGLKSCTGALGATNSTLFRPALPMSMRRTNTPRRIAPVPDPASMRGASSVPPARRTASIGRRQTAMRARLANSSPRPRRKDTRRGQGVRRITATTTAF